MSMPLKKPRKKERLTEAQRQFVQDNLEMAEKAASWGLKTYRKAGLKIDDAISDAYMWLTISAARYRKKFKVKFLTFFLTNWQWWIVDIRNGKSHKNKHRIFQLAESYNDGRTNDPADPRDHQADLERSLVIQTLIAKYDDRKGVLKLVAQGITQKEVAKILKISRARVFQRIQKIKAKVIRDALAESRA